MEEINNILYLKAGFKKNAILELMEKGDFVKIKVYTEQFVVEKEGENYFETLIEVRKELEDKEIALLCKGCCRNVYPSGMILNMGTGRKAYILQKGIQARMSCLVDIFEPCLDEEYALIEEQEQYFKEWIKSLGE